MGAPGRRLQCNCAASRRRVLEPPCCWLILTPAEALRGDPRKRQRGRMGTGVMRAPGIRLFPKSTASTRSRRTTFIRRNSGGSSRMCPGTLLHRLRGSDGRQNPMRSKRCTSGRDLPRRRRGCKVTRRRAGQAGLAAVVRSVGTLRRAAGARAQRRQPQLMPRTTPGYLCAAWSKPKARSSNSPDGSRAAPAGHWMTRSCNTRWPSRPGISSLYERPNSRGTASVRLISSARMIASASSFMGRRKRRLSFRILK